jgi:hypothetical protein
MPDYVICVRNVRQGKFGAEPGSTRFFFVPGGRDPAPDHAVSHTAWAKAITAEGASGVQG